MHPTSLAKRQLDAQNRSMAAAEVLAQRAGVSMPDMRQVRQPAILQLLKWEALADVLEALANTQPGLHSQQTSSRQVTLADVLAIEGLSKASIKALRSHFGEESTDEE